MAMPVMCETKRCGQQAARVSFYDAGKNEHRLCVWCALDRRRAHEDRREDA